jgi:hypothetical protein
MKYTERIPFALENEINISMTDNPLKVSSFEWCLFKVKKKIKKSNQWNQIQVLFEYLKANFATSNLNRRKLELIKSLKRNYRCNQNKDYEVFLSMVEI